MGMKECFKSETAFLAQRMENVNISDSTESESSLNECSDEDSKSVASNQSTEQGSEETISTDA